MNHHISREVPLEELSATSANKFKEGFAQQAQEGVESDPDEMGGYSGAEGSKPVVKKHRSDASDDGLAATQG